MGKKALEGVLTDEGFVQSDEPASTWNYEDETGKVVLVAFPMRGYVEMVLLPSTPGSMGDSALGALIQKAEWVTAKEGSIIELGLAPRPIEAQGQVIGQAQESLMFTLQGGLWVRTSLNVNWKK